MARRLEDLCPLWLDGRKRLRNLAYALLALATLMSILYSNAYTAQREEELERLRYYAAFPERLQTDYVNYIGMQPFWTLANRYLIVFAALGAVLLCFGTAANYLHCRDGARGDYTLRRLRDPWEYRRRCLALPLIEALMCLLALALLTGIFYWAYLGLTPRELLPPVGRRFWAGQRF